jgi:signal transduction histidine kinase/ligand-binding sensor domain-containing protein
VPNASARLIRSSLLAGLVMLLAQAVAYGEVSSNWFFRAWQSDEGLPNNTVTGLAQTPDGYLWLGTPSSLVRFDGIRFEDFSPTNFVQPPNRGAVAMLCSRSGALWLALDRGAVVCLDGRSSRAFVAGLPTLIPSTLAEDVAGSIWISYRGGAVCRLEKDQITSFTAQDGLPDGSDICALTSDNKGRIWFCKNGQCGMFRDGKFQTLLRFEPLPARLGAAKPGGVWLCSGFHLYRIDERNQPVDLGEFHPERAGTIATVLLEDSDGAVWIGTSYSGLFRHDDSGFSAIETSHAEIMDLEEDREGNLWVGTAGGGLNRIRRRAVTLEGTESGLPFAAVQSICEDTAGTLWAVTQNGVLARRVNDKWEALSGIGNWPRDVTCVTSDGHGGLWLGGHNRTLYCWRDGRFVDWGEPKELRGQTIHTLLVSRDGALWIGEETPQALQRLRHGRLQTFEVPQDIRIIRATAEDAAGNIWAGTSKGVLLRVSGERLTDETPRRPDELASIRCLYATPDGSLWIGYAGWGVGRIRAGHYAEIRTEQGLYDDYISHILPDGHGWLWFGANRGIFKVRQADLGELAEGRSARVRSIHYGRGEGLPSLQGTFGDSPDVVRSRDGRLWIPMRTALAVVDPKQLGESPAAPPTLLHRVSLDERTVAWYGGVLPMPEQPGPKIVDLRSPRVNLRLPPAHRRLEFEFAALSFAAPENVQFRYRLEGIDENWRESGTQRVASYSRLSAADYRFHVQACNNAGIWNGTEATVSFVVAPFFWQTWSFRLAVLSGFTLALIALVRYVSFRRLRLRLRQLEQQAALHKERARIAKDIHDDLGANLTQISLLSELTRQDMAQPDKAGGHLQKISLTSRQVIKSLDEIVWAVNPRNDTLAHLIDYSGQFAIDYLGLAGIRCRLDFPEQSPPRELSTDVRHNLFLAVKEALHNIVKHAHASEVWLRISALEQGLQIVIEDNGCGFDREPDDAWADGLRNMRQRLAELGGQCRIASHAGTGTKVTFTAPWPKE